jgi:hypothetical protein
MQAGKRLAGRIESSETRGGEGLTRRGGKKNGKQTS